MSPRAAPAAVTGISARPGRGTADRDSDPSFPFGLWLRVVSCGPIRAGPMAAGLRDPDRSLLDIKTSESMSDRTPDIKVEARRFAAAESTAVTIIDSESAPV
jgi:hypothetical protein